MWLDISHRHCSGIQVYNSSPPHSHRGSGPGRRTSCQEGTCTVSNRTSSPQVGNTSDWRTHIADPNPSPAVSGAVSLLCELCEATDWLFCRGICRLAFAHEAGLPPGRPRSTLHATTETTSTPNTKPPIKNPTAKTPSRVPPPAATTVPLLPPCAGFVPPPLPPIPVDP